MSDSTSQHEAAEIISQDGYHPWVHRVALLAPWVAMVTIIFGALTTTKDAGMAFRDWPTSDGQNMITYPWFNLFGDMFTNRDSLLKFLEHGHRLAGVLIGIVAIILAGVFLKYEKRRIVKSMGVGILLAVIIQGLLGGFRVELNRRGLATVHGSFAALVFSLMCIVGLITSRAWWRTASEGITRRSIRTALIAASITTVLLMMQYIAGGLLRHHGLALHSHIGLGVVGLIAGITTAVLCWQTREKGIQRTGLLLGVVVSMQFSLGLGAFVTKFGFIPVGYTAVMDSIDQVFFRTAHMVVGVLVIATATTLITKTAFRFYQLKPVSSSEQETRKTKIATSADQPVTFAAVELKGGLS